MMLAEFRGDLRGGEGVLGNHEPGMEWAFWTGTGTFWVGVLGREIPSTETAIVERRDQDF